MHKRSTRSGQGGQQSIPNTEQTALTDEGDPIPDIDVKMGKDPGGAGAGAEISNEGDPTVDAAQSNVRSLEQSQAVVQNGNTEDSSTNEWAG